MSTREEERKGDKGRGGEGRGGEERGEVECSVCGGVLVGV